MASYRLTPRARDGLRDILDYVDTEFGHAVAERVLDRLVDAFAMLGANPGVGHRRDDLTSNDRVRFWSVGPTLIAYRAADGAAVEILIVERGERDWERLLKDAPS